MPITQYTTNSVRRKLVDRFARIRQATEDICGPLEIEDFVIQTIEDVSPPKWHLGHTTWFFERVILQEFESDFAAFDDHFNFVFNSYYEAFGDRVKRDHRGTLSRPIYSALSENMTGTAPILTFIEGASGLHEIGADDKGFAYDNEFPRHKVYLAPHRIANRPVTNGEYLEFIRGGGYSDARLWLSDGWDMKNRENWRAPLYWAGGGDDWMIFTLAGNRPLQADESVCHVSYYEAAAFARWAGKRLPTEQEWEVAANHHKIVAGTFLDDGRFHPRSLRANDSSGTAVLFGMLGDVWEWTGSAYLAYPGYHQAYDALGEYNGKFMSNQMVLRGGCCATPRDHIRTSYRNFFHCDKRWQFAGIRLAEDI